MKRINSDNSDEVSVRPGGAGDPSAKQELALRAVISHPTLRDAAAASVSEATLWRYKRDPEFLRRLREARREASITPPFASRRVRMMPSPSCTN